jgi:hypothetical protein
LEALIAAQANALSSQQLLAEFSNVSGNGGGSTQQDGSFGTQQTAFNSQGGATNGNGFGIGQAENLLSMLTSGDAGATSQVTDNSNGSTTTTITYADGSTVALTTAAPSSSTDSGSGTGSSTSNPNTTLASLNLIEQMIQIQAQTLNPTSTQSVTA